MSKNLLFPERKPLYKVSKHALEVKEHESSFPLCSRIRLGHVRPSAENVVYACIRCETERHIGYQAKKNAPTSKCRVASAGEQSIASALKKKILFYFCSEMDRHIGWEAQRRISCGGKLYICFEAEKSTKNSIYFKYTCSKAVVLRLKQKKVVSVA